MQILEDDHIVEPGQTFMFIRIHMLTVEEEQFDLIHDLPEALGFANTTGIQTDVVAPAYGQIVILNSVTYLILARLPRESL